MVCMAHGLCVGFSDINLTIWLVDDKFDDKGHWDAGCFFWLCGVSNQR